MFVRFILFSLIIFLLGGCGSSNPASNPPSDGPTYKQQQANVEKVTLQLNWFPEAEHGGFYAAKVHGFFEAEDLEVEIIPGGPNVPVIPTLDTGRVDFAVTNADRIIFGQAAEADVVALMAPIQDSPRCIMVHDSSGIKSLEELSNVTLAIGTGPAFFDYMKLKLPLENVETTAYPGSIGPFLANERFAQQAYVFSEPFLAKEQGGAPISLMVSELGYNPYASLLVARRETITNSAELTQKLVRASVRGWMKYLESPEETNKLIASLNPDMSMAALAYGADEIAKLCKTANGSFDDLGTMTTARWQMLIDQLVEIGRIDEGEIIAKKVFSTDFLIFDSPAGSVTTE